MTRRKSGVLRDAAQDLLSPIFSMVPVVVPSCLVPLVQQAAGGREIMEGAIVKFGLGGDCVEEEWNFELERDSWVKLNEMRMIKEEFT